MADSSDLTDAQKQSAVQDMMRLTGYPEDQATALLESANWQMGVAASQYFADTEEALLGDADSPAAPEPEEPPYTGPRTLDGRPAPQQYRNPTAKKAQPKKKGVATLSSLSSGHDHDHDDDDDDEEDEDETRGPRDLFAGGEKSGLAVQDPAQGESGSKKIINDILAKAKANARADSSSSAGPSRTTQFRGSGQTLGGEGVDSRTIPDPRAPAAPASQGGGRSAAPPPASNEEPQERVLHLWRDGFSIDDGELHRFDDPDNAMDLQMIRQGRAPLHLMNVRYDQPVDVKLQQHQEDWHQLPKVYRPFGGSGRRLGSPVPGDGNASVAIQQSASSTATPAAAPSSQQSTSTVDESQPTLTLRLQLPNGTRLPARFNTTQTVNDVYEFIQRASPDTRTRSWVLATTFPNKEHTDRSLVLGEMPEFKKGATAVVKWA